MGEPFELIVEYSCTDREWSDATAAITADMQKSKSPAKVPRRQRGFVGWLMFLGLAVVLFLMLRRNDVPQKDAEWSAWFAALPIDAKISIGVLIAGVIGCVAAFRFFAYGRQLSRERATTGVIYIFASAGLTHRRPGREDVYTWQRFNRLTESGNCLLLWEAADRAIVLPK